MSTRIEKEIKKEGQKSLGRRRALIFILEEEEEFLLSSFFFFFFFVSFVTPPSFLFFSSPSSPFSSPALFILSNFLSSFVSLFTTASPSLSSLPFVHCPLVITPVCSFVLPLHTRTASFEQQKTTKQKKKSQRLITALQSPPKKHNNKPHQKHTSQYAAICQDRPYPEQLFSPSLLGKGVQDHDPCRRPG